MLDDDDDQPDDEEEIHDRHERRMTPSEARAVLDKFAEEGQSEKDEEAEWNSAIEWQAQLLLISPDDDELKKVAARASQLSTKRKLGAKLSEAESAEYETLLDSIWDAAAQIVEDTYERCGNVWGRVDTGQPRWEEPDEDDLEPEEGEADENDGHRR
jgi:hypothetical protein